MTHGYLKAIFDIFDKHQCPVDMVSTSEVSVSLTVDSTDKLPAIADDLGKLADVKYEGRKALVCMVGEDIRGQNGHCGAGVCCGEACECADDFAGSERNQHELHD